MVERRDIKPIDAKMHVVNNGDILITCNITKYMGW